MATVFVWQNNFISTTGAHTWTGHSSLSINDIYIDTRPLVQDDNDASKMVVDGNSGDLIQGADDFVSFWPGSMTDAGSKNAQTFNDGWKFGCKFMAKSKPTIFADLALEGYAPDHIIRINGLSISKMRAEWRSIRGKQNASYKFLRKNCSTIVARVLSAATPWYKTPHHILWTPCDIRDFAFKLGTVMTWSDFIDELQQNGFGTAAQLNLARGLKRRSAARGTSGVAAKFA